MNRCDHDTFRALAFRAFNSSIRTRRLRIDDAFPDRNTTSSISSSAAGSTGGVWYDSASPESESVRKVMPASALKPNVWCDVSSPQTPPTHSLCDRSTITSPSVATSATALVGEWLRSESGEIDVALALTWSRSLSSTVSIISSSLLASTAPRKLARALL